MRGYLTTVVEVGPTVCKELGFQWSTIRPLSFGVGTMLYFISAKKGVCAMQVDHGNVRVELQAPQSGARGGVHVG